MAINPKPALAGDQQDILTASRFIDMLSALKTKAELEKVQRFFRDNNDGTNRFLGVRMAKLFELAGKFSEMPLNEIDKLLTSEFYEARLGGVSIMDFRARNKKTPESIKKKMFDLYIKRHDRINNWDMVDRSAPHVVGGYLSDKSRTILYKLAKSKNALERRTAIVSTWFFIRQNDLNDTFKIAEILVDDKSDLVQKAVGSWVREAGKRDQQQLIKFLDKYAATMPRTTLRYAIEKLGTKEKAFYMKASR